MALLVLVTCVSLFSIHGYRAQYAYVGDTRYERELQVLDLSGKPLPALEALTQLPNLQTLDLRDTGVTIAEYEALKAMLPRCHILWDIPFQGAYYDEDTRELTVTTMSDADVAAIAHFPKLTTLHAEDCPDYVQLDALRQLLPVLDIHYNVPVTELKLPAANVTAEELAAALPYLTQLKSLTLQDPTADVAQLLALEETYPELALTWELTLCGQTVSRDTTELDIVGQPVTVSEIDAVLPYLPNVTFLDMTDCGIPNEDMAALRERHKDNVKIVWTVILGTRFRMRTDSTWCMPGKPGPDLFYPSGTQLYNLRYCNEMVAIDLGHCPVTDCEWAAFMPNLKYLIIADTKITDLTPLTGLTELAFLEMFLTHPIDYAPLATLTGLEDLNLSYTKGDANIIAQMTWLKNLWWRNGPNRRTSIADQQMLKEALPNCNFMYSEGSSTGGDWRLLPNYFAQRDIFGLFYMYG